MVQRYRIMAVMVWAMVAAVTVSPVSSFGRDYYVDAGSRGGTAKDSNSGTETRPWKTLNRAVKELKGGDTLWVRGGVYKETVNVTCSGQENKPVTIKAYKGEEPVIGGGDKPIEPVIYGDKTPIYGVKIKKADYLSLEGLTISSLSSNGTGIAISEATGVTLKKITVRGGDRGVSFDGCRKLWIQQCDISECEDGIIGWGYTWDVIVSDNHVHHNRCDGICIRGPPDMLGARGVIDILEPLPNGLARFSIKNPKTGDPVKLNFMRDWSPSVVGKDKKGKERYPTVLLLYYSEKPRYLDDKMPPGGTVLFPDGARGFPLRNNREWNDKPYSPDEQYGLFETGGTPVEELAKAKYAYLYYQFNAEKVTGVDLQVLRNETEHNGRQGILITRYHNVLIKDNKTHDNGATGIQVENFCRNFWVEGNECYANSQRSTAETGIWIHGAEDCIVQNNRCYENTRGIWVGKTGRTLMRRNIIYDNQGQHAKGFSEEYKVPMRTLTALNAIGIAVAGKSLDISPDSRWITGPTIIVHNTLVGNGTDNIRYYDGGGVSIGLIWWGAVENNLFLNNILVQNDAGKQSLSVMNPDTVMDGNIYYNQGRPFTVNFIEGEKRWFIHEGPGITNTPYVISDPDGLRNYRAERRKDEHSLVAAADFIDADNKDFHLKEVSEGIDKGVPLAHAMSDGSGNEILIDRADCFSDGFRNSRGELLIPGDDIMVGGQQCRIENINRGQSKLRIDRKLKWTKGSPVTYVYKGRGPDIGAYE